MTVLAFISSPLELIRVPELMIYFYNRLTAVTRLEREKALSKVRTLHVITRDMHGLFGASLSS